jgi:hypothetical protein
MYKNVFFLFIGYWSVRTLIYSALEIETTINGSIIMDLIMSPSKVVVFLLWFIIGIFGYTKSVEIILRNIHSVIKSMNSFRFEMILHLLGFTVSYLLLFMENQLITGSSLLLCTLFGVRSFLVK